jgi:hypothetical protein
MHEGHRIHSRLRTGVACMRIRRASGVRQPFRLVPFTCALAAVTCDARVFAGAAVEPSDGPNISQGGRAGLSQHVKAEDSPLLQQSRPGALSRHVTCLSEAPASALLRLSSTHDRRHSSRRHSCPTTILATTPTLPRYPDARLYTRRPQLVVTSAVYSCTRDCIFPCKRLPTPWASRESASP